VKHLLVVLDHLCGFTFAADMPSKLNIVPIMADDLGFSDLAA